MQRNLQNTSGARRSWLRILALLAVLALVAAACGGDGTTTEPTDDVAEPEPTDTEPEATEPEPTEDDGDATASGAGDGLLHLGYVLPETGQLAFLGPPMIAGVEFAVEEMNAAGGVLGQEVQLTGGDSGDGDGTVANQTVDRLLADGVDAILGAAASGISLTIIDKITGAGVIQCSPSNTSPTFTTYDDGGFYYRTAPTDALQGPVLADTIVADGNAAVAIMARADDYGQGLADATEAALQEAGAEVVAKVVYDPMAQNFDADVEQVASAGPDAVALIAFDEGARILTTMIEQGIGPADITVYGADGLRSNELASLVDPNNPGVLDGMKGTAPASETDPDFIERLQEFRPELTDTLFAAESFDCTNVIGLAAIAAGTDDPAAVSAEMIGVTVEGTECSSFAECAELLEAGEDINYQGVSGPVDFNDNGEPSQGIYEVWQINAEGEIETVETVESSL